MNLSKAHIDWPKGKRVAGAAAAATRPILIFSADLDVAKSLVLLLEESFAVVYETRLDKLRERIAEVAPAILMVDLYPLPPDILRAVDILRHIRRSFPVVTFYVYRNSMPEVEQAIRSVSDIVLYKPITAELVSELVSVLMAVQRKGAKQIPASVLLSTGRVFEASQYGHKR